MIPLELLLMLTSGAVFPYLAFAIFDWITQRRMHS